MSIVRDVLSDDGNCQTVALFDREGQHDPPNDNNHDDKNKLIQMARRFTYYQSLTKASPYGGLITQTPSTYTKATPLTHSS